MKRNGIKWTGNTPKHKTIDSTFTYLKGSYIWWPFCFSFTTWVKLTYENK